MYPFWLLCSWTGWQGAVGAAGVGGEGTRRNLAVATEGLGWSQGAGGG